MELKKVAALCGAAWIAAWPSLAAAPSTTTIWFYHDDHYRWCALAGHQRFLARDDKQSLYGQNIRYDVGRVDYVRGLATAITSYRSDAEGEVSTETTYALDQAGNVTSAKLVSTEQYENEPKIERTYWYKVTGGAYQPESPQAAKAINGLDLRRLRSLSAFPTAAVLEKARVNPAGGPFCTGPMKNG